VTVFLTVPPAHSEQLPLQTTCIVVYGAAVPMNPTEEIHAPIHGAFVTTHWSLVQRAAENSSLNGQAALEELCRIYWYPLYACVRRKGHNPEEAQDLTQAFFARLLEKSYISHANPQLGKFRTFLLTSLQRFLVNEWQKATAKKRGGGASLIAMDAYQTETRYQAEPADALTPEKIFEKRWALALLDHVLGKLQAEFASAGKLEQFEAMKILIWGDRSAPAYSDVATRLRMTEGALKVAVHRLRHRYRELLRDEVARTVAGPSEVDEELRHLLTVVSS
jgi:RNA polymerase sigma factor (sigma-70 family)